MAKGIQAGDQAPDFTLPDQNGAEVKLSDRLGQQETPCREVPGLLICG